MIEIRNLTKTYGAVTAVDDLTVTIRPGKVTGFLGPNGAGKSTTMRAIVGLDRLDAGDVLIGGRRYADDPAPLHTVGALLDARAFHPGRSARAHLQALAATQGIGRHRVDEVLDMVGLRDVAHVTPANVVMDLAPAVARADQRGQAARRDCRSCGRRYAPGWMHSRDVCHGCAERELGVVY